MLTTIDRELRAHRARTGLTQEQVARRVGTSKQSVMNWECGKHAMSYEDAWKLADLYGCTLDELGGRQCSR